MFAHKDGLPVEDPAYLIRWPPSAFREDPRRRGSHEPPRHAEASEGRGEVPRGGTVFLVTYTGATRNVSVQSDESSAFAEATAIEEGEGKMIVDNNYIR